MSTIRNQLRTVIVGIYQPERLLASELQALAYNLGLVGLESAAESDAETSPAGNRFTSL
jgi:hypothetical protein